MKWVIVIINMLSGFCACSQNGSILVCDSMSKVPLAFAHISTPIGTFYADADGRFPKDRFKEKEFTVSYLGYFPKKSYCSNLTDTIYLKRKSVLLTQVDISVKSEPFEIGYHKLRMDAGFGGGFKMTHAVRIDGTNKRVRVEEVIVSFSKLHKGFEFNLYAFEVTEKGLPGMLLFSDTVVALQVTRKLRIDVQHLGMDLPENGIFIGIKRLDENQKYPEPPFFSMSYKSLEPRVYFDRDGEWQEYDLSSLIAPNFPVLMIGLKVKPI